MALVALGCGEEGELARASGPGRRGEDGVGVGGGEGILRGWNGFLGGRGLFLGFLFVMRRGSDWEVMKMSQVIMGKSRWRVRKERKESKYLSAIVKVARWCGSAV